MSVKERHSPKWAPFAWGLVPVLLGLLAHSAALGNQFTNWDDPFYVIANTLAEAPMGEGLMALLRTENLHYPIPVTVLGYAAQRAAFGLDPFGYHAVSLGVHLACVMLVFGLGLRFRARAWAAALGASLFAVHPVLVEPIAWATGQKDLWCALFVLGAVHVRLAKGGAGRLAPVSILLCVLAMASKPTAVMTPALLILCDLYSGRKWNTPGTIATVLGLLGLGALITVSAKMGHTGDYHVPIGIGSLTKAAWAFTLEFGHILWPTDLSARYYAPEGGALASGAALGAVFVLGLTVAFAVLWRRGYKRSAFIMGAALLAYVPVAGLIPIKRGPADSYLYLPLAFSAVGAAVGLDLLRRARSSVRLVIGVVVALVLVAGVITSRDRAGLWMDGRTLWANTAAVYPDEPQPPVSLGKAFLNLGEVDVALAMFIQVEERHPDYLPRLNPHAQALHAAGRAPEAEVLLARAAELGNSGDLDHYGWFLATQPNIYPSNSEAAEKSLLYIADDLAKRGRRKGTLLHAAQLLDGYGHSDQAAAIRARAATR